jgi:hypothetical protein
VADHSILLAWRSDALCRFCWGAVVPSVLIAFGHFSEVCIQLRNIDQSLQSNIIRHGNLTDELSLWLSRTDCLRNARKPFSNSG